MKQDREHQIAFIGERIKDVENSLTKQMNDIRSSIPDFSPMLQDCNAQWKELTDELMADKTIKEFVDI